MLKIKLPFGFKTLCFDNLYVFYTGKIRVKANYQDVVVRTNLSKCCIQSARNGCVIISYMTKDHTEHTNNIQAINELLADVMHARIDAKYFPEVYQSSIIADELPF